MESQMARPHGQSQEQEHQIRGHQMEAEDEHHHENKSVLKKVKAKAKKIKDTLTKHSHGHNHDHDHIPDDHDLDEDDDEEEEMVNDPEIHVYDSEVIKSVGTVEASGQSGINAERSIAVEVDPMPPAGAGKPGAGSHAYEQEESKRQHPKVDLGLTSVMGEAPKASQNMPVSHTVIETHNSGDRDPTRTFVPGQEEHPRQPKVNLQIPKGGTAPKDTPGPFTTSNYQTKVSDPAGKGGKEAGITPVLDSLEKMRIYDDPRPKSGDEQNWPIGTEDFYTSLPTGSHDQFSPELTPPKPVSEEKEHSVGGQDKGVSVKDYFAEKLRPGEGDRALSEVISEALHKKAEQENKPASSRRVTEMISDALLKRKEEPNQAIDRPMGKVTESEEVARRLGTSATDHDSSEEGTDSSFVNNSGMGMVDKIKDAVGSWFGAKGEETQGSQQSHSNSVDQDTEEG